MTTPNINPRLAVLALLGGMLIAGPAAAQDGFLYHAPVVTIGLRVGGARPAANDELFQFFTDTLTLDRGDFAAVAWAGDLGVRVHPKVDALINVSGSRSSKRSEFENWIGEDNLPIEQTTTLRRTFLTAGLKYYLISRGRTLGKFAWVPTHQLSPYIGASGGVLWYRLEQFGDFVDKDTREIFTDAFVSDGAAPTAHVFAGTDLWLLPRIGVNLEGRYMWGSADLNDAFDEFDRIDLRGFQLTTGLTLRF